MNALSKPPNMPWHQAQQYWLCILPRGGRVAPAAAEQLTKLGMREVKEGEASGFVLLAPQQWGERWMAIYAVLTATNSLEAVDAAVIPGDAPLDASHIASSRRNPAQVHSIAESLWLGDAMTKGDLLVYLQPVVSAKDKIFGYESFARARKTDGGVIGGGAVVKAAHALSLQYAVDRHMQILAVKAFVSSELHGSLFINFIPGFIQRPEVYMEGLTEAVKSHGVVPRQITLDVIKSESPHDLEHMKRVAAYCRTKGYALALDDVESLRNVRALLPDLRPDYVKLDMNLIHSVQQPSRREVIRQIVEECHRFGAMTLAEGVESEDIFNAVKDLGVDLFQGYYFSPPVPVESVKAKTAANG